MVHTLYTFRGSTIAEGFGEWQNEIYTCRLVHHNVTFIWIGCHCKYIHVYYVILCHSVSGELVVKFSAKIFVVSYPFICVSWERLKGDLELVYSGASESAGIPYLMQLVGNL